MPSPTTGTTPTLTLSDSAISDQLGHEQRDRRDRRQRRAVMPAVGPSGRVRNVIASGSAGMSPPYIWGRSADELTERSGSSSMIGPVTSAWSPAIIPMHDGAAPRLTTVAARDCPVRWMAAFGQSHLSGHE